MDSVFGIGSAEFVLILILATIIMGPRRMRGVARQLGFWTAKLQAIARGFRRQLNAELDAESREDLKGAVDEIAALRRQVADLRSEIFETANEATRAGSGALEDTRRALGSTAAAAQAAPDETANRIQPPLPTPIDVPDDPDA